MDAIKARITEWASHVRGYDQKGLECEAAWRAIEEAVVAEIAKELHRMRVVLCGGAVTSDEMRDYVIARVAELRGNWPEDAADTDNGNYQCRCFFCGATFIGHKRRVVCKACAAQPKPIEPSPCACCDKPASHIGSDGRQRCSEHTLNGDQPVGGA